MSTRCFCAPCAAADSFKNPTCEQDSYDAFVLQASEWCLQCSACDSEQYESRACRAKNPGDVGYGTPAAHVLDRQCQDCTQCGYDEYEVFGCKELGPRSDRVCTTYVMNGYPRRRVDGATGRRGRLQDGFTEQRRNEQCEAELEMRYSDNSREEGEEAWFKIEEVRRSSVQFSYVFRARNHFEYRFLFGEFPSIDLRFRLSYLQLSQGDDLPADRPAGNDARWRSSNTVELRTRCVESFTQAEVMPGYPKRSVQVTGLRGDMKNAFDLRQRNESCGVVMDVRYVCQGAAVDQVECPAQQTFLIRETRRSNIDFARSVVVPHGSVSRLNLGLFPDQDIRLTLYYPDGSGGWQRLDQVDVSRQCAPTFEPLNVVSTVSTDQVTPRGGRLASVLGRLRDSNGDVLLQVDYYVPGGPATDRFVIRETRRSNIPFAKEITIDNGQRAVVNLGQFPGQDMRFGLFHERFEGRGDWKQGPTVDIGTQQLEQFESAVPIGMPRNTTTPTGPKGRIEGMFGDKRASGCRVHVTVRFWDEHRCGEGQSSTFLIRETRRSSINFARTVTLGNG